MKFMLSHRAKAIQPSPTLAVSSLAKKMIAAGEDVINFGVGEPDFPTPDLIKEEAVASIRNDFTRYTNTAGILELRKTIAEKLRVDNGLTCRPDDILVSPGAKASIMFILMTICDPRDEVLIPSPYWVSYASQVEMVDAKPVFIPTTMETNFKITADELEDRIKNLSNPRILILNSPNNPTGCVYNRKELEQIAEVCLRNDILIISDEIYEKLIYDGEEHISIASLSNDVRESTIVINGVSKAYAMTGWRLGYAAGPNEIMQRAARIQSHTTSCVNSITQKAAIIALRDCSEEIESMRRQFQERRNFLVNELNKIPDVKCNVPKGAFYAMPDISFFLRIPDDNGKKPDQNKQKSGSEKLCEFLLKEYKVALVPGSAFGSDKYVRFSYANSMKNIEKGLKRFRDGLTAVKKT